MRTLFTDAGATLSLCRRYRYKLWRVWDRNAPMVTWIMLNPSTADADVDDPTIRRCVGFARAWGAGGIQVVNLFALRATNPKTLREHEHPFTEPDTGMGNPFYGGGNDAVIQEATEFGRIIAAWGCHGTLYGRDEQVMELLIGRNVECLGVTKEGNPRHPLYVSANTTPVPFGLPNVRIAAEEAKHD